MQHATQIAILILALIHTMGIHLSKEQEQAPPLPQDPRPKLVMLGDSTLDNIVWVGSY